VAFITNKSVPGGLKKPTKKAGDRDFAALQNGSNRGEG